MRHPADVGQQTLLAERASLVGAMQRDQIRDLRLNTALLEEEPFKRDHVRMDERDARLGEETVGTILLDPGGIVDGNGWVQRGEHLPFHVAHVERQHGDEIALRMELIGEIDREDLAAAQMETKKGDQDVRTRAFFGEQLQYVAIGLEWTELLLQPMASILKGDLLVEDR